MKEEGCVRRGRQRKAAMAGDVSSSGNVGAGEEDRERSSGEGAAGEDQRGRISGRGSAGLGSQHLWLGTARITMRLHRFDASYSKPGET